MHHSGAERVLLWTITEACAGITPHSRTSSGGRSRTATRRPSPCSTALLLPPPARGYTKSGVDWARALWRRLFERARRPRRRATDEPSVARSLPFLGGWFDKLQRGSLEVVRPGGLF